MRSRIKTVLMTATLACSPFFLGCGGGGGGGSQAAPPPPPAPTRPEVPTGLRVQLETRVSESSGYTYFHVTWSPSPGSIGRYEVMVTHPSALNPSQNVSTLFTVYPPDPLSLWVGKDGPELALTAFKVRALDPATGLYSDWSPIVTGTTTPWIPSARAVDDSLGAPPRCIKLTIQKQSEKAEAVRIYRAEGDEFTHTPWQPIVDLSYGGATTLEYLDQSVLEDHAYVYLGRNLAAGLEGDPGSASSTYVYLFSPDPFMVTPGADGVDLAWTPRSLVGVSQDLFRTDFGLQGGVPIGNHLVATGTMDLSSMKDVPYQSGFFAYYTLTHGATTQRYSDIYPCRYLGPDARPATEAISEVPFPYGIPGGRPSGPYHWFLIVDDHLEVYTWKNGAWSTDVFSKVDGMVRPGVRLDRDGNPYFFYRVAPPTGSTSPTSPPTSTLGYACLKNGTWTQEIVDQWSTYLTAPGWVEEYAQGIGVDGSFVLVHDLGGAPDYAHQSLTYLWNENGTWQRKEVLFGFDPYTLPTPLPFQIGLDGSWVQPFNGGQKTIVFTSIDHGTTWTRSEVPVPGTPLTTAVGLGGRLYCFSSLLATVPPVSPDYLTDYELVCSESGGGLPDETRHVLYYNHTGHPLSLRHAVNPVTGQVGLLADPSTGLIAALKDASGWKLRPALPGEWRWDDRLDTCLFAWEGPDLVLLADAAWGDTSVTYLKMVLAGGPAGPQAQPLPTLGTYLAPCRLGVVGPAFLSKGAPQLH